MFIQWIKFCSIKTGKIKSEKGFTLLELMLVLVVVSVLSSVLVMPFISNLNEGGRPDIYATATQLATADIEDHRSQAFATGTTSTTTVINGRSYIRDVVKANATLGTSLDDYIKITATVTTSNPALSVSLISFITPDNN
jgi:prepilin-type N-terminal cleavage/methylation domain-containing protein